MPEPIYLDHNATTPLLPEVAEVMRSCWAEPLLNPASQHAFGRRARQVLEDVRERIAELVGAKTSGVDADRVVFTSGGTESNNLAIRGLVQRAGASPPPTTTPITSNVRHLITTTIEHPSVASLAEELTRQGHTVDKLPVDSDGVIRVETLETVLRPQTAVVAAILGQNETGVLQPIAEIAARCTKRQIPVHTDATQVVGKLPVNFRELGVNTMTFAAHKFHGPIGIGALVVRHGVDLRPQLFGGFQQSALRSGTESVALVVGMQRALELWHAEHHTRANRMRDLRDRFERAILNELPHSQIIGGNAVRLPHTSNIAFIGIDRQALFLALDQAGVACSTGSACASGSSETSPVLVAMGCEKAVLESSLRFSLGATTTIEEVDEATRRIIACCNNLRRAK